MLAGLSSALGLGGNTANRAVFLEDVNDQAGYAYRPAVYPGQVTLFLPQRNYHCLRKPYMGWKEFCLAGVEIIKLPVYPGGMFVEPYVGMLADKLRARIDEAEKMQTGVSATSLGS